MLILPGKQCKKGGLHCDCYQPIDAETMHVIPPVFDFDKFHRWHTQCEATHGECCNERYSEALAQQLDSLLLVDIVSGNLVTLPSSTKFVALSYVWGNVPTLKSGRDNVDALKTAGALFREPFESALPDTIRDAMHVVKASGQRYLWVDCLSLIQDAEKEHMENMLRAMARIYASAEYTIVAAQGDNANHGLRGAGGPSRERQNISQKPNFCDDRGSGFPWHSCWASRGWTFQETLFSRRLLIFDDAVSWICGRQIRLERAVEPAEPSCETTVWPVERPHLGIPMGMMSLIPNKPSLGRWGMIIENFSSRELTFEHDTSRALAGATEVMAATFPGGLYHGLPLFFFDIALLWQPRLVLRRRDGEPSWSWKGWKGGVDCLSPWQPFFPGVYRRSGSSLDCTIIAPLKSLVLWSFSTADGVRVEDSRFLNGFYKHQAMRADSKGSVPSGWQKHSHPNGPYFTDVHYPTTGFQYAYPLPTAEESWKDPTLPSSSILSCIGPVATATLGVEFPLPMTLTVMHGTICIGFITYHSKDLSTRPGSDCKLVAISWGEITDVSHAYDHPQLNYYFSALSLDRGGDSRAELDPEDREFCHVLCIEEQDGVAYRKGLGMVSKRRWEGLGPSVEVMRLG